MTMSLSVCVCVFVLFKVIVACFSINFWKNKNNTLEFIYCYFFHLFKEKYRNPNNSLFVQTNNTFSWLKNNCNNWVQLWPQRDITCHKFHPLLSPEKTKWKWALIAYILLFVLGCLRYTVFYWNDQTLIRFPLQNIYFCLASGVSKHSPT